MNHGDDDNDNDVDKDYNLEGNDDELLRFDYVDDMYYVLSQNVRRSQTNTYNDKAESNIGRHSFKNIRVYTSYIHNLNPF